MKLIWSVFRRRGLLGKVEDRHKKLLVLEAIVDLVSKAADLHQNLNAIVHKVVETLEVEAGEIYLWDRESEQLVYIAHDGLSDRFVQDSKSMRIGLGDDIPGRVVQLGEPIFSKDISKDPRLTRVVVREEGYRAFISVPLLSRHQVVGTLNLISHAAREFSPENIQLLMAVGSLLGAAIEISRLLKKAEESYYKEVAPIEEPERSGKELKDAYTGMARALVGALEARDPYTRYHSERVMQYALDIAVEMGYSQQDREVLEVATVLHDIGKIGVESNILNKAEPLTYSEWTRVRLHPIKGVQILYPIKFLEKALPIIEQLHERYDGKGYPHHNQGEQIPLGARILSVADAYDAMTSDRPYRPAISDEETVKELKRNAGTQFDPTVVKAFLTVLERHSGRAFHSFVASAE